MVERTCGGTCTRHIAPATRGEVQGWGAPRQRKNPRVGTAPSQLNARKFELVNFPAADFAADAELRYREAVARRDAIRDAWQADGAPLLSQGFDRPARRAPVLEDAPRP
jgi:hypothetical protein